MNDILMGVAKGLYGHIVANKLFSGAIRETAPTCKPEAAAAMAAAWEDE